MPVRLTSRPQVLDGFSLSDSTYLIFYAAIDVILILVTTMLWGVFRLATRSVNPPRLHFTAWMKVKACGCSYS